MHRTDATEAQSKERYTRWYLCRASLNDDPPRRPQWPTLAPAARARLRSAVTSPPGHAAPGEDDTLDDPSLYLNRELTWLAFNQRVLAEAETDQSPLLERVKFLAITGSNLDEFFMKRIGGLKQQAAAGRA